MRQPARKPFGKALFLFALLLLLAWICGLPWILVDSDPPLTRPLPMLVDPAPTQ